MTDEQIAKILAENESLKTEIKFLREKIDALVRRVFGSSSEKMSSDQLNLVLEELAGKAPAPAADEIGLAGAEPRTEVPGQVATGRGREKRRRFPEDLPVEEDVIIPLEVQAAPEQFRRIGEEVTERLDYQAARYFRRRTVRPTFVSRIDRRVTPVTAPMEPQLADKLMATPAMIAHVVVCKYADHLPLFRQADILQRRHGIAISRQTLCNWVMLAAHSMQLVYEEIRKDIVASPYLQVDETPVRYLSPGNGRCEIGYLWTVHRPDPPGGPRGPTLYQWHPTRATKCLSSVLGENFSGIIQCDGYSAYQLHATGRPITLAACWAHARRKFFEARDYDPAMLQILDLIGSLYAIEERLRVAAASTHERQRVRQNQSAGIVGQIHGELIALRDRFLPKSCAGKAIAYTLGLWDKLTVYLGDGRLEIDNNLVENAIRPTALGKKNWLFIGDKDAGQMSAILFTLMAECRRLSLDPHVYLTKALTCIPAATTSDVPGLTPSALATHLKDPVTPAATTFATA